MGRFVWVGTDPDVERFIQYTDDLGVTWTPVSFGDPGSTPYSIAKAGDRLLIGGTFIAPNPTIAESADAGETWEFDLTAPSSTDTTVNGFAYSDTDEAAVAATALFDFARGVVSGSLFSWSNFTAVFDQQGFRGAFGDALDRLCLAGFDFASGAIVATSDDGGLTWTLRGNPFTTALSFGLAVAWSPSLGLFVLVGHDPADTNKIASSPDGIVWTPRGNPFTNVDVACVTRSEDAGFFMAGDLNGDISRSADGMTWDTAVPTGLGSIRGIAYGDGIWMAVGDDAGGADIGKTAAVSDDDGLTWTLLTTAYDGTSPNQAIANDVVFVEPVIPPAPDRVWNENPWRSFITDKESRTLSNLDRRATDRQVVYVLNGPASATGQVASDDPEINLPFPDADSPALLTQNRRLLFHLYRDPNVSPPYQPAFGGIVMGLEDQGTDAPTTRYTAYDPWQYMYSRPVRDLYTGALPEGEGITFDGSISGATIALQLLEATQLYDGETHIDFSDLSLVGNTPALGGDGITFGPTTSVGEAWDQLVQTGTLDIMLIPMYEPISAPGKCVRFACYAKNGTYRKPNRVKFNMVMAWDRAGREVAEISRLIDGTRLANDAVFWTGDGTPAPEQIDAASVAAYGVYFAQQMFPDTADPTLVAALAFAQVEIRRNGGRTISLDPTPERTELPVRDYWIGDYVLVWSSRNLREPIEVDYLSFDPDNPGASGYQLIYVLPISIDDNGVARVRGMVVSKDTTTG